MISALVYKRIEDKVICLASCQCMHETPPQYELCTNMFSHAVDLVLSAVAPVQTESACPDLVRTQITLTCKQLGPEAFRHAPPSSGPGCQMRFTRQKTASFRRQLNANLVLAPLSIPPPSSLPPLFLLPHFFPGPLPTFGSILFADRKELVDVYMELHCAV